MLVGQGGGAQGGQPNRGDGGGPTPLRLQRLETAPTPRVRVAVALDQALAAHDLRGQGDVATAGASALKWSKSPSSNDATR